MTAQKVNSLLSIFQTVLSSLAVTGITFCLMFLWRINGYIEKTQVRDDAQDAAIYKHTTDIGVTNEKSHNMENRIITLEAILSYGKNKKNIP